MSVTDALALFAAAFGAGIMNSIAGGGTFLTLPTLIFLGMPAKMANATSTIALWPGSMASTLGYLPELRGQRRLLALGCISIVGGLLGARLLVATGENTFETLIPWLLLIATATFALGPRLAKRLRRDAAEQPDFGRLSFGTVATQFVIAVYGGYFGAGIGILMLAALALSGMDNLHRMNALKNALASAINAVAVATFLWEGLIRWPEATVMIVASIAGGIAGVKLARVLPTSVTRAVILGIGTLLTVVFFWRTYA